MTEINLTTDINHLRAIYFRDNRHKYFFGPATKKQSTYLTIGVILFPILAYYTLSIKDGWLLIFGAFSLCYIIYDFWKAARVVIQWRKSVEQFLIKAENIKDLRFVYNDDHFTHIQNNETLKQDWSVIEKAIINDQLIWLFSDTNLLLPKSSMSDDEFRQLSDLVLAKVKNVERES